MRRDDKEILRDKGLPHPNDKRVAASTFGGAFPEMPLIIRITLCLPQETHPKRDSPERQRVTAAIKGGWQTFAAECVSQRTTKVANVPDPLSTTREDSTGQRRRVAARLPNGVRPTAEPVPVDA